MPSELLENFTGVIHAVRNVMRYRNQRVQITASIHTEARRPAKMPFPASSRIVKGGLVKCSIAKLDRYASYKSTLPNNKIIVARRLIISTQIDLCSN